MLRKFTLASVAIAIALASCQTASAFWWRHGGSSGGSSGGYYGSSGGSSGGYGYGGSSGGSSGGYYGSSGGSSGGYGYGGSSGGSSGGGLFHHHHRRSYWGGYGSSGGSSGGYYGSSGGSSGGYSGGYGSSGGSSGGWGSSGGYSTMSVSPDVIVPDGTPMMTPGAPMTPPATPPAAPAPAPAPAPTTMLRSAILTVQVPGEAQVFVNGLATTSTGANRRYVSNGLEPGFSYTYELRAEVVRDGKTVTETKSVKLKAGETANVNFGLDTNKDNQLVTEPGRTSLTLHVPADSKVYLSGNATNSFGETREFSTTKLASGAEWKDYVVRVEFEQNGKLVTKEKTITLAAGEQRELTIGLDVDKVASSNR